MLLNNLKLVNYAHMSLIVMWKFWPRHRSQTVNFSKFRRQFQTAAFQVPLNKNHQHLYNVLWNLLRNLHLWFFSLISQKFSFFLCFSPHHVFFNIWISTFFLYHITLFHEWETILIFYVSYTKNTLKKLSNKFAWQISAKFFNSPQMNPKLLKFPSWNQPSKKIEQTYLQPVNTTRLSNSPPE